MLFLPIEEIEVFDQVNNRSAINCSLHVDGESMLSCYVRSTETISSCGPTVGAFRNESKRSLVAWIDPASGRFISLIPIFGVSRLAAVAISVGVGLILFLGQHPTHFDPKLAALSLGGAMLACVLMLLMPSPTRLEMELRREFERRHASGV